jgi:hypothetical protein
MRRARLTTALLALVCGAPVACGGALPLATPAPTPAPVAAPATNTPAATTLPSSPPPTLTPGRGDTLVPPRVHEVRPAEAAPGQDVRVIGSGGFVKLANGGYDESSRGFPLLFDEQPLGKRSCYVNRCEGALTIPANATPGPHLITSEGGAITVTVR